MTPVRWTGFVVLLAGIGLQPVGWMYVHWLTAASLIAIVIGVALIYFGADRGIDSTESIEKRVTSGRDMPGDIHGHSGQMSGGRSTSWESHSSSNGGAEDGGASD